MRITATTSFSHRPGGPRATSSMRRHLASIVTSASLFAMLFVTAAAPVAARIAVSTYHPLAAPVRIVDSRSALGLASKLSNGIPQSFQVTGNGGVPAGATAITGNLTVTGQTARGYVSLTTASNANPGTSTLNFPINDDRANGVTTPLGAGGALWAVYKSTTPAATTELVFDVTGYFTNDLTGSSYHPLAGPVRIVDSRSGLGLPTKLSNGVPQSFQVTGATAITGNLTVTGQTALGYVSLTTASNATPGTSTLNFPINDDRANGVSIPLGAGGVLWAVYKSTTPAATTHLIFDVTGYFTADLTGIGFLPLAGPVRIVDSRSALGLATKLSNGMPQSFQVAGAGGCPPFATAITGNLTVTQQTALGYVSLTTASNATPGTSTLNFPINDDRANGVSTPLGAGGKLWAVYKSTTVGATTQLIFDVTGCFA